ncbi:MAG TPA: hypothetical protein VE978_26580 [Chitinophagales bacterium]|nr:hypothetical protein [Chitinophagales bacterium]
MKTENVMGTIKAEIEFVNPTDLVLLDDKKIEESAVRRMNITALADTGAYMLCINEPIRQHLGLRHMTYQKLELADGSVVDIDVVGPVIVNFKNRTTACPAIALPNNAQPLLGSIPMVGMDVVLVPLKQTIDVNPEHPLMAQTIVKQFRQ